MEVIKYMDITITHSAFTKNPPARFTYTYFNLASHNTNMGQTKKYPNKCNGLCCICNNKRTIYNIQNKYNITIYGLIYNQTSIREIHKKISRKKEKYTKENKLHEMKKEQSKLKLKFRTN